MNVSCLYCMFITMINENNYVMFYLFQTKFGGHGFSHILENVVPMMQVRGFTDEVINKIMATNPQAAMTYHK